LCIWYAKIWCKCKINNISHPFFLHPTLWGSLFQNMIFFVVIVRSLLHVFFFTQLFSLTTSNLTISFWVARTCKGIMKKKILFMFGYDLWRGANKIQWANKCYFRQGLHVFLLKNIFLYKLIFKQNILQIVIKIILVSICTWHVFLFIIFE
jgi:hypothetical protein